jgi:acetylornithine/succinyldiaminopimelate/putrescine aminotransferase
MNIAFARYGYNLSVHLPGNGFPMAAVVTTPEIAQSLTQVHHFNTFGGNPLASAVGKAVLEVDRLHTIFL